MGCVNTKSKGCETEKPKPPSTDLERNAEVHVPEKADNENAEPMDPQESIEGVKSLCTFCRRETTLLLKAEALKHMMVAIGHDLPDYQLEMMVPLCICQEKVNAFNVLTVELNIQLREINATKNEIIAMYKKNKRASVCPGR